MKKLFYAGTLVTALGCMGLFQSYSGGVAVICDAPINTPELDRAPPDETLKFLARHISENLHNQEAVELFKLLSTASPKDKASLLGKAAKKANLEECKLAELFNESYSAFRREQASYLCELSSCETFVATEPTSILGCAEPALANEIFEELKRMNLRSPAGLARDIASFVQPFELPSCAVVSALRNAQ